MATSRLRVIGAVVFIYTCLVLVACGPSGGDSNTGAVPLKDLKSFYLEAEIHSEASTGAKSSVDPDLLRLLVGSGTFRWWYEAPNKFRWEIGSGELKTVALSDGKEEILYRPDTNEYQKSPAPAQQRPVGPLSAILVLGPGEHLTVDELIKSLDDGYVARKFSGGKVAGFDTVKVEGTPDPDLMSKLPSAAVTALAAATRVAQSMPTSARDSFQDKLEFWMEPTSGFILKERLHYSDGSEYRAEVKKLTFNGRVDPSAFVFNPPKDAVEASTSGGGQSFSGTGWQPGQTVPSGFGVPTYVPSGLVFRQGQQETLNGKPSSFSVDYGPALEPLVIRGTPVPNPSSLRSDETPVIKLSEGVRKGGLDTSMKVGTPTPASFGQAYVLKNGDASLLLWSRGDVIYGLAGRGIALEELIKVAESIR
jgi:outer membrane lipoprotein-sorting protein